MGFGRPFQPPSTGAEGADQLRNLYHKLEILRKVAVREQISAGGTVSADAFNTVLQALAGLTSDHGGRRR